MEILDNTTTTDKTNLKPVFTLPKIVDDGSQQWGQINKAFGDIYELLKTHADELQAIGKHSTGTITYAISDSKVTTIVKSGKHLRAKITNAYVVMGDSAPEEINVELLGISDPVRFSGTEKTGKVKIFTLKKSHVHFFEDIQVRQTGNRRLLIGVTLESEEA